MRRAGWRDRCGLAVAVTALAALATLAPACRAPAVQRAAGRASASAAPRLVVLVAVDQLRGDLLPLYAPAFTGGLRWLLAEGRHFPEARIVHTPSNSMPGHVTLATGAHPRRHGIVDNGFFEQADSGGPARYTMAVADSLERIVGASEPGVSPRRLLTTGLADWVLAHDSGAVAAAISMNEYGALLHAGRGAERRHVFWYSPAVGRFVTSTYYASEYPAWVESFNARLGETYLKDSVWTSTVPAAVRALALPDSGRYEHDHVHTAFPHRFAAERDSVWKPTFASWLYFTPYPDAAALALARDAVRTLRLGQRGPTDYLSVTLGGTDHVGHWYGPRSQEQLDNLLRLDRALGEFLEYLDASVGHGNYVLALSADHGVADIPEALPAPAAFEFGTGAGLRVSEEAVERLFDTLSAAARREATPAAARSAVREILRRQPFVAAVMTREELADTAGAPADSFVTLFRNGFHPRRTPARPLVSHRNGSLARYGLTARLAPGAVVGDVPAEHGSPYEYDRRVALVLFGTGVSPGVDSRAVYTVDVAPTLAALAAVPVGATVDGRALVAPIDRQVVGQRP